MANITITKEIKRITTVLGSREQVVRQLMSFGVGLLISIALPYGSTVPLGVAWVAAVPSEFMIVSSVGSIFGYILTGVGDIHYPVTICLLVGLKWALAVLPREITDKLPPLLAGISVIVTGGAVVAASGGGIFDIMLLFCESFVTVGMSFIFHRAASGVVKGQLTGRLDYICGGAVGVSVLLGTLTLQAGRLSVGTVVVAVLCMAAGAYSGIGGTSVVAAISAIVCTVGGQPHVSVPIVGAALCGALFYPVSKLLTALSFVVSLFVLMSMGGAELYVLPVTIEAVVGTVVFLLLPRRVFSPLTMYTVGENNWERLSPFLSMRLKKAGEAFSEVASLTTLVNKQLDSRRGDDIDEVYAQTGEEVCRRCKNTPICWQTGYGDTMRAFSAVIGVVKGGGTPTVDMLSEHIKSHCPNKAKLLERLSLNTREYIIRYGVRQKLSSVRSVVTEQFEGVSSVLSDLSREMGELSASPAHVTEGIKNYFEREEAAVSCISCMQDRRGLTKVVVNVPINKADRVDVDDATEALSRIVEQDFMPPLLRETEDSTEYTFLPKPPFTGVYGFYQSSSEEMICGDSVEFVETSGRLAAILSDGMGVGGAAAVNSTMTTALLSRITESDISFESALRLVNGALLLKSGEESLSTVDAVDIDLHTLKATFYKAGAAVSYVVRGGRVLQVEAGSLPAGILKGVTFEKSVMTLSPGDIIVLLSDGVVESGESWVPSSLLPLVHLDPQDIAKALLTIAKERTVGDREDDMSVLAVRVEACLRT